MKVTSFTKLPKIDQKLTPDIFYLCLKEIKKRYINHSFLDSA